MRAVSASFRKLQELEQRSLVFEPGQIDGKVNSGDWAGVIFRIGTARLACNLNQVHEFLPVPTYTPVPGSKPWVMGLANVHGDLMTIIDLACFLNGEHSAVTMRTRLLAVSLRGRPAGLLVDEVFGQRHFVSDEGKKTNLKKNSPLKHFVHRQFRSGKDTWQELDLDSLFATPAFLNGAVA